MKISTSFKYLLLIFFISFILFSPSLKVFYTNDDFFLLKIAQAGNFKEFLNFFNLTKGPDGLGMYRPLTTQVFYFLSWKFFNLNPLGLHIVSFAVFFGVIFLVYKLAKILTHSKNTSLVAAFLYATSATHFGHLYYLATFQELGMTFTFLLSVISFVNFLKKNKIQSYLFSFFAFLLSLLSKETAVVLPFALILVYWFIKGRKETKLKVKNFILKILPFFLILSAYFYMRLSYYGFAKGESYIWDFSPRVVNTLGWYGLWSLNLPEMLVDYVGPGLNFNPNLFRFWSREITPIFILFSSLLASLAVFLLMSLKKIVRTKSVYFFSFGWFVLSLIPVLFLPLHKFTFYLTLPLLGIVVGLADLIENSEKTKSLVLLILTIWLSLSILTLTLTSKTHWISVGAKTAENVHSYLVANTLLINNYDTVAFYDTKEDESIPWRPSELLRVILSDQNYFKVFWNDKLAAKYYNSEEEILEKEALMIKGRKFLGY